MLCLVEIGEVGRVESGLSLVFFNLNIFQETDKQEKKTKKSEQQANEIKEVLTDFLIQNESQWSFKFSNAMLTRLENRASTKRGPETDI